VIQFVFDKLFYYLPGIVFKTGVLDALVVPVEPVFSYASLQH